MIDLMNKNDIKILLTGDFCPINRVETLALKKDYSTVFNNFIDVFRENDLNITDLECPLTGSMNPRLKTGPHQKADPACINLLEYLGFNIAAMANNHIMDFGSVGAEETVNLCRNANIRTVGIGPTAEIAAEPLILPIKGKKLAVLNYADNEFLSSPDHRYHGNPIDSIKCYNDIQALKQHHDFILVVVHAGNEFYELPSPRTKLLYRFLIDSGADAVVSHHTHAFSGYEVYKSRPVFYGLGNFLYDWPGKRNSTWNKGYCVRLTIGKGTSFEIIPLIQCNDKPGIFHPDEKEREQFFKEIARLNEIIADDEKLESEYNRYCSSVFPMYDAYLEPYFGRIITALRKRGFFPKLISKRKRRLYLNVIRCESHRDILLRLLGYHK